MRKQNQFLSLSLKVVDQEIALGLLMSLDLHTLVEKPGPPAARGLISYEVEIPQGSSAKKILLAITKREQAFGQVVFTKKEIIDLKNDHWKTAYESFLKPFMLPVPKGDYPYPAIKIDPNPKEKTLKVSPKLDLLKPMVLRLRAQVAFGTGAHHSTQLAALLLQKILWQYPNLNSVLDMGAGSGILTMVAKLRGAKTLYAVEIDEEALQVAKKNFLENGFSSIQSATTIPKKPQKFEVIVANILAPTLIKLAPLFAKRLKKGGHLILSGLTYKDSPKIKNAYQDWQFSERINQKGWSAWHFIR